LIVTTIAKMAVRSGAQIASSEPSDAEAGIISSELIQQWPAPPKPP